MYLTEFVSKFSQQKSFRLLVMRLNLPNSCNSHLELPTQVAGPKVKKNAVIHCQLPNYLYLCRRKRLLAFWSDARVAEEARLESV